MGAGQQMPGDHLRQDLRQWLELYGWQALRVDTVESDATGARETMDALESLFERVYEDALPGAETIVRNNSIRVFMGPTP